MEIKHCALTDLDELMPIFHEARRTIAQLGIDQWQDGYPSRQVIEEDITLGRSYCILQDRKICGTFVLVSDGEPTYNRIYNGTWLTGNDNRDYIAIHRVAISVANRGSGISSSLIAYAVKVAENMGKGSLRIDTHEGNVVMRRMLEKNGFVYCGVIYLESGVSRVAYEKII
ncbi:MAG: GNAT family N-acetyltransferase [Clostridia bacterium]|nr:GNAT family N-acetyltransferase [Clostridia bacterium]